MSSTLADPYRALTTPYPHHANGKAVDNDDLIAYGAPQSLRSDRATDIHFHSDNHPQSSFGCNPQARVARISHSPSTVHHDPQSAYIASNRLPRQLPAHYSAHGYSPPQDSRKQARSEEHEDDDSRELNHNMGIRQNMHALPMDGPGPAASPDMLFPVYSDPSPSHAPSTHKFASPTSFPLPQHHHHHRLPSHASLQTGHVHGSASPPLPIGPPSVVGQPGMPDPAPRPRGPKLKFTPEDDALLVELKENKNLTWKQIADFFPGRTSGTLQVRYCTKLKAKDVIWNDDMLQRLQRAMEEYEKDRWRIIAGKVGHGFTPAACRERALNMG
ncbi:hypothetical protein NUU61_005145 [Penicillium alfredii]|uniref:Myb-like domain-containing protein n=1 Tax=Penicillium alfredii TaxID=1506179 RepID=A0A9W9K7B6_9EURO|nr:uncharacterized protein NUU61_005145 [Penicillium alfredii]KAJ5095789.1 hypothetical protein NUU61_005145 [Penicillium alfredii]